jgi:hypothetical protein
MSNQIKKKHIGTDSIDGSKIKLGQGEAIRALDGSNQVVDLIKIDTADGNKIKANGQEIAFSSQLSAEESSRISGDSSLQSRLSEEESARASGDAAEASARSSAIAAEASAREEADDSLEARIDFITENVDSAAIDSLVEVVSAFQSVDGTLSGAISALTVERINAEDSLEERISTEEVNREDGDASLEVALSEAMSSEVVARESADDSLEVALSEAMSSEVVARESADESLEVALSEAMSSEVVARESADLEFLKLDGSRPMQGDLSLGENEISGSGMGRSVYLNWNGVTFLDNDQEEYFELTKSINGQKDIISSDAGVELRGEFTVVNTMNAPSPTLNSHVANKEYVDQAMSSETSAREEADDSLESRLSEEESARMSGDTAEAAARSAALASEQSSRISGDASLTSALASEQSSRISGDNSLQSRLSEEESARASAVSAEASLRVAGDDSLEARIDLVMENLDTEALDSLVEVVSAFQAADGTLSGAISSLTADRVSAENSLASSIASEQSSRISGDNSLQSRLSEEESARASAVSAEAAARESADDSLEVALSEAMSSEVVARESADDSLESRLSEEESARMSGDTAEAAARSAAISSEASSRLSGDNSLETRLSEEESARASAVSAEESSRISGDASLASELSNLDGYTLDLRDDLDAEESARISGDNSLDARLDALELQDQTFHKMAIAVTTELGYVDLTHEAIPESLVVAVGRVMAHKDVDYTVSVVGGVSRLTWIGDFASGGSEAMENGDNVYVTYAY